MVGLYELAVLNKLTVTQVERILEVISQTRDGMFTKAEMANKIEQLVCADGIQPFETTAQ